MSSRIAVIYASKYGATREYAQWIAQEAGADLFDVRKVKPGMLADYQTVVFGGGIYAGSVRGAALLAKNTEALLTKRLALFTCGISDPQEEASRVKMHGDAKRSLPEALRGQTTLFHLRGRLDHQKLGFLPRAMMSMMIGSLKKKKEEELTQQERQMIESYGGCADFVARAAIGPVVQWAVQP